MRAWPRRSSRWVCFPDVQLKTPCSTLSGDGIRSGQQRLISTTVALEHGSEAATSAPAPSFNASATLLEVQRVVAELAAARHDGDGREDDDADAHEERLSCTGSIIALHD